MSGVTLYWFKRILSIHVQFKLNWGDCIFLLLHEILSCLTVFTNIWSSSTISGPLIVDGTSCSKIEEFSSRQNISN